MTDRTVAMIDGLLKHSIENYKLELDFLTAIRDMTKDEIQTLPQLFVARVNVLQTDHSADASLLLEYVDDLIARGKGYDGSNLDEYNGPY